jgi:glycosyltransferase involved in cell wall biosynthesis
MKKFAVGIPTINRADLLNQALHSYFKIFPNTKIFIIDNGNQNINERDDFFEIHRPDRNLGVSASWNLLCKKIFKDHEYALILNDDIQLSSSESTFSNFFNSHDFDLVRCYKQFHLCSFAITKKCFMSYRFDETFYPAYYEDRDMLYRLKLDRKKILEHFMLNPQIFRNSQTISTDGGNPELNKNFQKLTQLYIEKWGGPPDYEKYKTPFNK